MKQGVVAALLVAASAQAQTVPIQVGNPVRVARADSASAGLWRGGTALAASWRGMLLRPEKALTDTVRVPLNGSYRVQVRQRPRGWALVGSGMGAVVGGVLGATVLHSAFGRSDRGVAVDALAFGALGALVGAGVGAFTRPKRWQEIAIPVGGFAITPLSRPAPAHPVSFGTTERWREFEVTEGNLLEFMGFWQNSLHVIEGVWELDPGQSTRIRGWRGGPMPRMAVVRDGRYEGYDYVAFEVPPRPLGFRPGYQARILFALRPLETPGLYGIRYARGGRQGVYRVEVSPGGWLEFQFTGGAEIEVWDKLAVRAR